MKHDQLPQVGAPVLASAMEENAQIAACLREAAALLEAQAASPHRVNAYRRAADVVARESDALRDIFDARGRAGLQTLPAIGPGISSAIAELLITGRWNLLDRLRGGAEPEALHIPAHDGAPRPTVEQILDVDREYRAKAAAQALPLITPRRFNPQHKPWLPVLHTERGPWHFTALNSNTALAHKLGRMRDWVVIYYYDGEHREGQCTVVTETRGSLAGERVVRGREVETLTAAPA